MARKVYNSTLNASTIDILNVIRENAGLEYQQAVPPVETIDDIPKVGDVLYGYPALANTFLNSLMNRIALVLIKSATYNDPYKELKKGELEFGETVEEVFVQIAKAREFNIEKAPAREFKRTIPDVRTAFHVMNLRVQYPITIQDQDLRQAFVSAQGVQDMIERIVSSIYNGWEYDEFLLFKYLLIKAISKGKMTPIAFDDSDLKNAAKAFRGASNKLTFMSNKNNVAGVTTVTPREDQFIFIDAEFEAAFDVDVLAGAFNMDKADYLGRRFLIDDWTTFDNERFSAIQEGSDQIEEVTSDELALMADVKAVLVDREWFQFYDNLTKMEETRVGSGMYTNYFFNKWCTVSSSPFSNAIVFVTDSATITAPQTLTLTITGKDEANEATILCVELDNDTSSLVGGSVIFNQPEGLYTGDNASHPIAITKTGSVIIPNAQSATEIALSVQCGGNTYEPAEFTPSEQVPTDPNIITASSAVGDSVTLTIVSGD